MLPIQQSLLLPFFVSSCLRGENYGLDHLEEPGGAHAAADAHRHHYELDTAALAFDQRMPDQAAAGHTIGMSHCDRTPVDVEAFVRNAQLVTAIDYLHCESLVQLPQPDVCDFLAGLLEQLRNGEHGPDAHLVGFAAGNGKAPIDAHRFESLAGSHLVAHQHLRRSTIGKLAGVARSNDAALDGGFYLRHTLVRRVRPDAFVFGRRNLFGRFLTGVLVDDFHRGGDRHDFVFRFARAARSRGALLAQHAVTILRFAPDLVSLRYHFRGGQHWPVDLGFVFLQPRILQHVLVCFVLHAGYGFDAARDKDVRLSGKNALRRQCHRLESRRTETVDGHARHRDRHARAQRNLARDILAGGAFGIRATHDDVLDLGRLELRALEYRFDDVPAHGGAMSHVERALPALAQRRARGRYDYCIHICSFGSIRA